MRLKSDFALLDVTHGRRSLDKLCVNNHDLAEKIPVVIHGFITGRHGSCDGISQEFTIQVSKVETK
jgi:hypothetical protein